MKYSKIKTVPALIVILFLTLILVFFSCAKEDKENSNFTEILFDLKVYKGQLNVTNQFVSDSIKITGNCIQWNQATPIEHLDSLIRYRYRPCCWSSASPTELINISKNFTDTIAFFELSFNVSTTGLQNFCFPESVNSTSSNLDSEFTPNIIELKLNID